MKPVTNIRRGTGAVDAIVIGAGHSGLAMSHCLSDLSVDHVILERGEVANSWRHERWDSLRLLTPNWQVRLPGYIYDGDRPDDFMSMPELIRFLDGYAHTITAPIHTGTEVTSVQTEEDGYRVVTNRGEWLTRSVVIASGAFNTPFVPASSANFPRFIQQVNLREYSRPDDLAEAGVLVVGASATGLQLADEIHRSGRPVTLSVGEHVRLPRTYRGRDIQWWMDATGVLDERFDEVDDLVRARHVPSPQLVGTRDRHTLDLNHLTDQGVRLVGRFTGVHNLKARFSGSLRNVCELADLKMKRLLRNIDEWVDENGLSETCPPAERFEPTRIDGTPDLEINLLDGEIRTILWATGFRPNYSWLDVPVLDKKGMIRHEGGVVTEAPGVYVMGLPFLRRRKSTFIHGAEDDARDLSAHLCAWLNRTDSSQSIRMAV